MLDFGLLLLPICQQLAYTKHHVRFTEERQTCV